MKKCAICFLALAALAATARAEIRVLRTWQARGTSVAFTESTWTPHPSGSDVTIEAMKYFAPDFTTLWEVTEAKVWVTVSTDTIGQIGFQRAAGVSGSTNAMYGNGLTIMRNGAGTYTPVTWNGTSSCSGFNVILNLNADNGSGGLSVTSVTGDVDDIVAISRLRTAGDLNGRILAASAVWSTDATSPFEFRSLARHAINVGTSSEQEISAFELGLHTGNTRIEATGDVDGMFLQTTGDLSYLRLLTSGKSLRGSVQVLAGAIAEITVPVGGEIRSALDVTDGSNVPIQGIAVPAQRLKISAIGVGKIVADRIVADIDADRTNTNLAVLQRVSTRTTGATGGLYGSVKAGILQNDTNALAADEPGIEVKGTQAATIDLTRAYSAANPAMVSAIKVDNGTGTMTLSAPRAYDTTRKARIESAANLGTVKGVFANRTLIVMPGTGVRCEGITGLQGAAIAVVDVQGPGATIGLLKVEGSNESLGGVIDVARIEALQVNGLMGYTASPANITVRQGQSTDFWWFDWGHSTGSWIDFVNASSPPFAGQVIFNRRLVATTWNGEIRVNGASIGGPSYASLSATIGSDADGGAIGMAPYALHSQDCLPANLQAWNTTEPAASVVPETGRPGWLRGDTDQVLRARFYGPIIVSSGAAPVGKGVTVQYKSGGTWTNVTDLFDVQIASATYTLARDIVLRPLCNTSYPDGLYRVLRNGDAAGNTYTSRLRSRHTNDVVNPSDDDEVASFRYYFKLGCVCNKADVGQQGGIPGSDCAMTNDDFVVFIDWFFANDPRADMGMQGGVPGSDGLWDNNDYVVFIDYFFLGCDQSIACSGFVGGGEGAGAPLGMLVSAPDWLQTGDATADRELTALWAAFAATGDPRVMERIVEALFNAGAADR